MGAHNVIDKIERAMASGDVLDISAADIEAAEMGINKIIPSTGTNVEIEATTITLDGAVDSLGITASGAIESNSTVKSTAPTGGLGYATGAGGAVTQATSKVTGVTLAKVCGAITTAADALAAGAEASFIVTNTAVVAATDVVVCCIKSGPATAGTYSVSVSAVAAGSFTLTLTNLSAGSLSEAVVINFAIIKAVAA